MNKKEFEKWYRDNIDIMSQLGVFHPDSPFGKTVHLAIASLMPQIEILTQRINNIEEILSKKDLVSDSDKKHLEKKIEKIKTTPIVIDKKPKTTKSKQKTKVDQPKKTEWQIGKR